MQIKNDSEMNDDTSSVPLLYLVGLQSQASTA